jgi:hypothetical protein
VPAAETADRLFWTARQDGAPEERLDMLHARLVEDLPGDRVRVLTQEAQTGGPPPRRPRSVRTRC